MTIPEKTVPASAAEALANELMDYCREADTHDERTVYRICVAKLRAMLTAPQQAEQNAADKATFAAIFGRPDKPFHKAECQCEQCLGWIAANPQRAEQAEAGPLDGVLLKGKRPRVKECAIEGGWYIYTHGNEYIQKDAQWGFPYSSAVRWETEQAAIKYCLKHRDPAEQLRDCYKCGQVNRGQSGEYLCPVCGVATTHDDPVPAPAEPLTNDRLQSLANKNPPPKEWLAGDEEKLFEPAEPSVAAVVGSADDNPAVKLARVVVKHYRKDSDGYQEAMQILEMDQRLKAQPMASEEHDVWQARLAGADDRCRILYEQYRQGVNASQADRKHITALTTENQRLTKERDGIKKQLGIEPDSEETIGSIIKAMHDTLRVEGQQIKEMTKAITTQQNEIIQILGKALSYPKYADDKQNFPDAKEADGVCVGEHTDVTLAMEAAKAIERLTKERDEARAQQPAVVKGGVGVMLPDGQYAMKRAQDKYYVGVCGGKRVTVIDCTYVRLPASPDSEPVAREKRLAALKEKIRNELWDSIALHYVLLELCDILAAEGK